MRAIIIALLFAGLAVALAVTNPSRADVDAEIQSQLVLNIDKLDTGADQDPAIKLVFNTCKISRSACAKLMQSFIKVDYQNRVVFSQVTLRFGNKDPIQCFGALSRVICPDF